MRAACQRLEQPDLDELIASNEGGEATYMQSLWRHGGRGQG